MKSSLGRHTQTHQKPIKIDHGKNAKKENRKQQSGLTNPINTKIEYKSEYIHTEHNCNYLSDKSSIDANGWPLCVKFHQKYDFICTKKANTINNNGNGRLIER